MLLIEPNFFQAALTIYIINLEVAVMPLIMAAPGEEVYIKRITGKEETKRFLENLGFVPGTMVKIISKVGENVIVNVKDTRVAISSEMAKRIFI